MIKTLFARLSKPDIRKFFHAIFRRASAFLLSHWSSWRRTHQVVAMWHHYHNPALLQL